VTQALATLLIVGAVVAMALAVVRLLRGPTQVDRIVALDVVFSASIVLTAAASLVTGRPLFLDIGIGLAIVGFVATIVWARLIDQSPGERP
jgi:multicomponent Na+:H+ antiporter subunit F